MNENKPLPPINKEAPGIYIRDTNAIPGDYRVYQQSLTAQKKFIKIIEKKTFESQGYVNKFKSYIPSANGNSNTKLPII